MDSLYESIFEINFSLINHNLNFLKKKLKPKTKIIAVVKAFAYGHGDIEIAKFLEKQDIYAFWVADFEEGVILRKNGITVPIIVANASPKSISQIIKYNLDIVVYNFRILDSIIDIKDNLNIHLKFNCGMNRYGFSVEDISLIKKKLSKNSNLNVSSICSHFSSSRTPKKDETTKNELKRFKEIASNFSDKIYKHILNTSGIIRFAEHQYSAVRAGIGIFGIHKNTALKQIGKLTTTISQIRHINKGEIIGYGGHFQANKKIKIGIVPFGYADGLDRKLGNSNGSLFVNGIKCEILGEISMDSCVINLNDSNAVEGDRVEIFGSNNSINSICKKIDSIPYEFLSKINRRIKRKYIS